jgi:TonB family protein
MLATRRLRLAPEWDGRFTRMVVLSGFAHVSVIVLILLLAARGGPRPLPMVAYTVELTDPNAVGGRLPPGRIGTKPTPEAAPAPPPPGPPADETASAPEPPPPAPEPQPAPRVEPPKPAPPKPEAAKPDAVKIEPAKKPEPPKPPPKPVEKAEPKPPPKPVAEKPKPAPEKQPEPPKAVAEKPKPTPAPPAEKAAQVPKPAGGQNGPADADAKPKDAYAAAAERWRTKSQAQGQGLGGTDGGSGPIGTGGPGPGGGGQVVGIEFLAYRQRVIATVKGHWTNVVATPGLVAAVRFEIAGDGTLGGIRLERSSGNAAYDSSVLRAVQRTEQLPPPPAKYAKEFGEFVIEFHSEEVGGKESG